MCGKCRPTVQKLRSLRHCIKTAKHRCLASAECSSGLPPRLSHCFSGPSPNLLKAPSGTRPIFFPAIKLGFLCLYSLLPRSWDWPMISFKYSEEGESEITQLSRQQKLRCRGCSDWAEIYVQGRRRQSRSRSTTKGHCHL